MARWRALPEGLDPAVAKLVSRLRQLKDASGRTIPELAKDTGYSTSSWERYFGGRALPPREAVEALARVVGADAVRLLAVHEVAEEAWRTQPSAAAVDVSPRLEETENGPPASAGTAGGAESRRSSVWRSVLIAGAGALVGASATALLMAPGAGARPSAAVARRVIYTCVYSRRDGLWYAGNSTTRTQQLVVDTTGSDVAELQCLLQRAGITPGGIDGSFGPLTEAAVIRAQKKFGLDVDGQVGPRTWAALRG